MLVQVTGTDVCTGSSEPVNVLKRCTDCLGEGEERKITGLNKDVKGENWILQISERSNNFLE